MAVRLNKHLIVMQIKHLFLAVLALILAGCSSEEDSFSADNPSADKGSGLYMGIVGFNETLIDKGKMSKLMPETQHEFTSFVDELTVGEATLLYYGVDKALDKIAKTSLPGDLTKVAIVTFTDGLDQGSLGMEIGRASCRERV